MDAEEMIEGLADLIADKVAAKLAAAGITGGAPAETVPADTSDEPGGKAPSRKRKAPAKTKKEPEPEPEEEEEEEEEDTTDLVTGDQLEYVQETADEAEIEDIRSELLQFYVDQGNETEDISSTLADMSDEELRVAYADYLARLVCEDGKTLEFIADFNKPYKASRVNDGETKLFWIAGGITLSEEDVKAKKLGDPNGKPKRTRKAPAKK